MQDRLRFDNEIRLMVVNPNGAVDGEQVYHNAVGWRTRDMVARMLTTAALSNPGTLGQVNYCYYRLDGSSILGTGLTWVAADTSGTAISTRYNTATYIGSVMFSATYTATAQVTCKALALTDSAPASGSDMGSVVRFWSTNISVVVSTGGKIIVQWTVSLP